MLLTRHRSVRIVALLAAVGLLALSPSTHAFFSKPATLAAKKGAFELIEVSIEKALRRAEGQILKHHGGEGVAKLKDVAKAAGKEGPEADKFLVFATKHRDDFSKLLRSGDDEALLMVCRNGDAGRFLFSRFYGQPGFGKGSPWFKQQSDEAIQDAWKLVRPSGGVDASWERLRRSMTKAGMNGPERDLAELLFKNRAAAGKIRGLNGKTLLDGHINGRRQGADFVIVDQKTGRPGILEFGTGTKPGADARQMTREWCRDHWLDFIKQPSNRTLLRQNGIDPRYLDPKFVAGDKFISNDALERIVCAPQINFASAHRLGVQTILLP